MSTNPIGGVGSPPPYPPGRNPTDPPKPPTNPAEEEVPAGEEAPEEA